MERNADFFSNGLEKVCQNNKWGYIDRTGKEVIPCQYDEAKDFSENLAVVKKNGKYGFVDINGNDTFGKIEDTSISDLFKWDNSMASTKSEVYKKFKKNTKVGVIDSEGKEILPALFDAVSSIEDGKNAFFEVYFNGKYGIIDKSKKLIVPIIYDHISYSEEDYFLGFFSVEKDGHKGLYDKMGNTVVPCKYDEVLVEKEAAPYGLFPVSINNKRGCVMTGKEVIECAYEGIAVIDNYVIRSKSGGLKGSVIQYFDKTPIYKNGYLKKGIKYREDYSNNTQHNKYDDKKYFAPRGTGFESPSTSSSYSNDSYSSPEWSEDDKATIQLVRIEKELRENVDRLAVLQLQPATFESNMEIQLCKQKIVNGFLSAIEVAKSVKDYKLAAEYEIRMNKAVTAMKLMPR